jgi:drug/metabolite transporter (DMT)-like permease
MINSANYYGILWMITHGLVISIMMGLVKFFAHNMPIIPIITGYGSVAFLLVTIYLLWAKEWRRVSFKRVKVHFFRSVLNISGLEHATMAGAAAVSFLLPLCVCLLGTFFFQEQLTKTRILHLLLGFIGVLIITNPTAHDIELQGVLAILTSVVAWSSCDIITKKNGQTESVHSQLFFTSFFTMMLTAPITLMLHKNASYTIPSWLFILLAVLFIMQVICIFKALQKSDFALVMPFDYMRLPMGMMVGFIVFGEVASMYTLCGAAIIIAVNYNLVRCERNTLPSTT